MKVLIVEDDPNKMAQIQELLNKSFSAWEVLSRASYQAGLKTALLESPDVLLLDMTMPTYDDKGQDSGGRERRYAGEQILRYLHRKHVRCSVVIVTQFERFGEGDDQITLRELGCRLEKEFPRLYEGVVFYQAGATRWMDELRVKLAGIEGAH